MKTLLAVGLLLCQAVISVQTELVAVPVTVTDAHGRPVRGLTQDNFRVFDDGRLQPIAVFHHGDVPVTIGVIVDRSQSMRTKAGALAEAVSSLVGASRPGDELFAVGFNDRVSFALPADRPFTSDARELEVALAAIRAEGRTALYDGVVAGLLHLERGRSGTRALVVVSDGGDNASRHTYDRLMNLARRSDAVIYAIGLMGTSEAEEEEDAGLLRRLCRDTGGVAYFPRTATEIAGMSGRVAQDIRDQYVLGFVPATPTGARAFRKIDVRVTAAGEGRLRVRARAGYSPGRVAHRSGDKDSP